MVFKTLITARGGSKEIPKKNIIEINGKPLIAYSILASQGSNVDETWVSTDDSAIKEVSTQWGAKVIDRPKELATDTILNEPSLLQFADQVKFDCIVFIQPTSPFIKSKYINIGIEMMKSRKFDSVFTATLKHWAPIWSKDIKPIEWEIDNRPRRQDREEYYEENGMFYITSRQQLYKNKLRYGGRIGIVPVPLYDNIQIDTEEDLELIKRLMV